MIQHIAKITLYVNDQQEAVNFWTEKMGFHITTSQPMGPSMKWIEVGPTKDSLTTFVLYSKEMMAKQNPATNLKHPSIILSTKDIMTSYEKIKEQGVQVGELMNMPYGKMFTFYDQDGNPYLLREDA